MSSIFETSLYPPSRHITIDYLSLPMVARIVDFATIVAICCALPTIDHLVAPDVGARVFSAPMFGAAVAFVFIALNQLRDDYRLDVLTNFPVSAQGIFIIWAITWAFFGFTAIALNAAPELSRPSTAAVVGLSPFLLAGSRSLVGRWFSNAVSHGHIIQDRVAVLQVGAGVEMSKDVPSECVILHSQVVSLTDKEALDRDLKAFLRETVRAKARKILVQLPAAHLPLIDDLSEYLRRLPIPSLVVTDEWLTRAFQRPMALHGELTAFELQAPPLTLIQLIQKRALDLVASSAGLLILSPVLLLVAIAVKLDSPGPVLFRQHRKGFSGKEFQIFKFRSMRVMEDGDKVPQAKRNDARVTRVGRFIRATSLDELPQLFNVLRGDMSLIGPRPHAIAHDNHFDTVIGDYSLRRHIKPGLTGWAQIHGHRGETPTTAHMSARVEYDLWYIANWSIWLDFWIIIRTVKELFANRNVY